MMIVAIFSINASGQSRHVEARGKNRQYPKVKLIAPQKGDTLVAGETVNISWLVDLPLDLDVAHCEQEIFLSLDGGKTLSKRITAELSALENRFEWIVPNTPSDQAVLVFHVGNDSGRNIFERAYPKKSAMFRIAPPSAPMPEIIIDPISNHNVQPGEQIHISWQTNIENVDFFQVYLSYDQGGHFTLIGGNVKTAFDWTVPADFIGTLTFRIVANKYEGSYRVKSVTDAQPQFIVTPLF
jgi:hypothetical protein